MPGGYGRRGGHGGGPRRRWGRRLRIVEPMLLLLLSQEPQHGYGLSDKLASEFRLADLPAQTVYRALQDMEEQGWISAAWDLQSEQGPPRKVYTITDHGKESLKHWADELENLRDTLNSFLD